MGKLDTTLFVTVGGPSVLNPIHIKSRLGSKIEYLLKDNLSGNKNSYYLWRCINWHEIKLRGFYRVLSLNYFCNTK
ncbi:MAG: hypothetical protein CM1200mP1_05900 [Candidatus Neomarinimicrobiota bacterium]|nr:MAG: hypothetical protein CM1200mP1_05900 [Candidatus Neomarinimicrobiota bacterium]